jgi:hypothetical protein
VGSTLQHVRLHGRHVWVSRLWVEDDSRCVNEKGDCSTRAREHEQPVACKATPKIHPTALAASSNLIPAPIRSCHACKPKAATVLGKPNRLRYAPWSSQLSPFEPREREWRVAWRAWHGDLTPCASIPPQHLSRGALLV